MLDVLAAGPLDREELLAASQVDPAELARLERRGLVTSQWEEAADRRRRIYRVADPQPSHWGEFLQSMGKVMRTPGSSC